MMELPRIKGKPIASQYGSGYAHVLLGEGALPIGGIYAARVIERIQNGKLESGLVLNGSFLVAKLPAELHQGDVIKVKVIAHKAGGAILEIINPKLDVRGALKSLMKDMGLTQADLFSLLHREGKELKNGLQDLRGITRAVITESDLGNTQNLIEKLAKINGLPVLISIEDRKIELGKEVHKNPALIRLHKIIDIISEVESSLPKRIAKTFAETLDTLFSRRGILDENKVKEFVLGHIKSLSGLEASLTASFSKISREEPLDRVVSLLHKLVTLTPTNSLEKALIEFASQAATRITGAINDYQELRNVLKEILKTLSDKFGPINNDITASNLIRAYKHLKFEIDLSISILEEGEAPGTPSLNIRDAIIANLEKLKLESRLDNSLLGKKLTSFSNWALKEISSVNIGDEYEPLVRIKNFLEKQFGRDTGTGTLQQEISRMLEFRAKANPAMQEVTGLLDTNIKDELLISKKYQLIARELLSQLQIALARLDYPSDTALTGNIENRGVISTLLKIMPITKGQEEILIRKIMEVPGLTQIFGLFAEILSKDNSGILGIPDNIKNILKDFVEETTTSNTSLRLTLSKVKERLAKECEQAVRNSKQVENVAGKVVAEELKNLEVSIKGHEFLKAAQPIIQNSSNSSFLVFPTVLQGFLSQIEIHYSQQKKTEEDSNSRNNKGKKEKEELFKLQLNLPSLGGIFVSCHFNSELVTINFSFEKKESCDFISERLIHLENAILGKGFESVKCFMNQEPRPRETPMVPEILKDLARVIV